MARYANDKIIDLHSTMVRFIICSEQNQSFQKFDIYIPLWLDLLLFDSLYFFVARDYLHSTMVRFIIKSGDTTFQKDYIFTFHYG